MSQGRTVTKALLYVLISIGQLLPVACAIDTCVALSNGSDIVLGALEEGNLSVHPENLDIGVLHQTTWPSYSSFLEAVVFEARDKGSFGIYSVTGSGVSIAAKLLLNGRLPSLSPDGRRLAYFDSSGSLSVHDLGSDAIVGHLDSIEKPSFWNRAVWVNGWTMVYSNQDGELLTYNVENRETQARLSEEIYPAHSTTDGLLLISRTGTEISCVLSI